MTISCFFFVGQDGVEIVKKQCGSRLLFSENKDLLHSYIKADQGYVIDRDKASWQWVDKCVR